MARNAGEELLMQQIADHLAVQLAVEPINEPPHLGALFARAGKQGDGEPIDRMLRELLGQVLRYRVSAAQQHAIVEFEHRQLARRIDRQELRPPLPGFFLDQIRLDAQVRKYDANRAGCRAEPVVGERVHGLVQPRTTSCCRVTV